MQFLIVIIQKGKGGNPNPKAVKIINPNYEPISTVAKAFLSDRVKDLKLLLSKEKKVILIIS